LSTVRLDSKLRSIYFRAFLARKYTRSRPKNVSAVMSRRRDNSPRFWDEPARRTLKNPQFARGFSKTRQFNFPSNRHKWHMI